MIMGYKRATRPRVKVGSEYGRVINFVDNLKNEPSYIVSESGGVEDNRRDIFCRYDFVPFYGERW